MPDPLLSAAEVAAMCGHWHEWRDQVIGGTRFICLPEPGDIGPPGFADLEVALP